MSRATIGGPINSAALAALSGADPAMLHRPTDRAALAKEALRLYREGLRPRDIAVALRWPLPDVLEAIRAGDEG